MRIKGIKEANMTRCSIMSCCEGSCWKCHMLKTGEVWAQRTGWRCINLNFICQPMELPLKLMTPVLKSRFTNLSLKLSWTQNYPVLTSITVSRYSLFHECPAQSLLTPLQGRRNSLLRLRLRIHCGYGNTTRIHRSHISVRCISTVYIYIWVCLKIVYPYTQWLMIIIPTKWL